MLIFIRSDSYNTERGMDMDAFLAFIEPVIRATAWKIETPTAYGPFHIAFMILGFSFSFLAARHLRNLSDSASKRLLLGTGIFLMLTEVYKQLLYALVISPDAYDWGVFPFHLCSIPMYLCVIGPLLRPGPVQKSIYSFMMLYNLLGGGIAFAEPSGLLHPYATLTAHAMIWHMTLVFIGLYLMFSGRGGFEIRDYKNATGIFLLLCCVAFAINLAFWKVSNGQLNMFFVGPKASSLIVFKQIAEVFGWYVSTIVYIPAVCLGAYLIFLGMRWFRSRNVLKNAEE